MGDVGTTHKLRVASFEFQVFVFRVGAPQSFALKVDFSGNEFRVLVRVTSWIVPFVQENNDDPRSHTNQHE